jgi:hypothetical protein
MKDGDDRLNRLFAAARVAPESEPSAMPARLQTRVIAQWRLGRVPDEAGPMLVRMFQRGLACAAVAMALAIGWCYADLMRQPQNYEDFANYEFRAEELP